MNTTKQFATATPDQREQMLNDGLKFLTTEFERLRLNLNRLNEWMRVYPALHQMNDASLNDMPKISEAIRLFANQVDEMGVATIQLVEDGNKLLQYMRVKADADEND